MSKHFISVSVEYHPHPFLYQFTYFSLYLISSSFSISCSSQTSACVALARVQQPWHVRGLPLAQVGAAVGMCHRCTRELMQ